MSSQTLPLYPSELGEFVLGQSVLGGPGPDVLPLSPNGVVRMYPSLWITDVSGRKLQDVSDLVYSGAVTMNQDAATALSFEAELRSPIALTPWADFLRPELKMVFADGSVKESQVGLFVVPEPSRTHTWAESTKKIDGRDLTYLLANDAVEDTYSIAADEDPFPALYSLIASSGVPLERIHFAFRSTQSGQADLPVTLVTGRDWPPGTWKLTIVNDVLSALQYYSLWMDLTGRLVSTPVIGDLASAEPSVTYSSGDGSYVSGPIEEEPSATSFANVIIITAGSPATADAPLPPAPPPDPPTAARTVRIVTRANQRSGAGTNNAVVAVLPVGTAGTITGGPVVATGYTWWSLNATIPGVGQSAGWSIEDVMETVEGDPDPELPPTDPGSVPVPPIIAIRVNDTPGPTSILPPPNGIGRRKVRSEAPSDIETQAQADAYADNLLQESLAFYNRLTLHTLPDPGRGMHEVYRLNITNRLGEVIADGNWLCRGWKLGFTPRTGLMEHICHRVQPYARTEPEG